MSNSSPSTYGLTYTENFEIVRQFVSERANREKREHDILFREHLSKLTNPDFKAEFSRYYNESQRTSFFGNNSRQAKLLEGTLSSLYYLNYKFTTNEEFASRIVKSDGFRIVITNEAKNLLSGTKSFSTEVAAKEAAALRIKNQTLAQENTMLMKINNELSTRITNLVNHLKLKLGMSDGEILSIQSPKHSIVANQVNKQNKKGLER